jgi:xanthine dehydrogenase iron-sulfur cluster and FAD-binding subunit A
LERSLIGQPLETVKVSDSAVAQALAPIDDFRADAAYRSSSAAELLRRALVSLALADRAAA